MAHAVFTIVAPIKAGCLDELKRVLETIQSDLAGNRILALSPKTFPPIHFASFVIFEKNTLVFENVVDGSVDEHLRRLAAVPSLDQIYRNCERYEAGDASERFAYLKGRLHEPQLYHVGTPYRTAESIGDDRCARGRIDDQLDKLSAAALPRQIVRPAAGMPQYWNWEIAKPWIACVAAALLLWLEIWLLGQVSRSHAWWRSLVVLDMLAAGAVLVLTVSLWRTSRPDLRRRVKPWIAMAIATLVVSFIARRLWVPYRVLSIAMVASLAGVGVYGAWTALVKLRSARLGAVRSASGGASPVSIWRALRKTSGPYQRERPFFLWRLSHWTWWLVAYAIFFVPVWFLLPTHSRQLGAGLVLLFFLEAVWLAVLVGWPSGHRWSAKIIGFIVVATVLGALLVVSMFHLAVPRPIIALVLPAALIALWSPGLPSPTVKPPVVDQAKLNELLSLEDHDAQNHMSALVELPGSRLRALSLKLFLGILNRLFYRSLLPDVWQGKLFGLPTVHFAQWVLLDDRRYLFLSNYDLSWTSYLDDFGMQLTTGIQKIWGQGVRNPGTGDLGRFKDYVRTTMVPHSVWYRAYPGLTVRQIWSNEKLRCELARDPGEEEMIAALGRLSVAPKVLPDFSHARVV
jgi:hypothetical protein